MLLMARDVIDNDYISFFVNIYNTKKKEEERKTRKKKG
jgi:hypothetical protein